MANCFPVAYGCTAVVWCDVWRSYNVTKDYLLRVGQVREVKLLITVNNNNEEAHETTVSIEMPPAFEYLGTDDRVGIFFGDALSSRKLVSKLTAQSSSSRSDSSRF